MSSRPRRISRSMSRSGRNPVAFTTTSTVTANGSPARRPVTATWSPTGTDVVDLERGKLLDVPGLDEAVHVRAELPACGEPIGSVRAEASGAGVPDRPQQRRARFVLGEGGELDERVRCRVAGPDDEDPLPGEPSPGPRRARRAERARCGRRGSAAGARPAAVSGFGDVYVPEVSTTARAVTSSTPSAVWRRRRKRGVGAAGGAGAVHALPGHRVDADLVPDHGASSGVWASGSRYWATSRCRSAATTGAAQSSRWVRGAGGRRRR